MVDRKPEKLKRHLKAPGTFLVGFFLAAFAFFVASCSELQKPVTEPFYSETLPPLKQEFRWSNGKMPKSFDPARAAAAPETDLVRAVFEGLTEIDSRTLKETPGVAEKWTSSEDLRVWTFQLRKDAKWSNGARVTAGDFVISWRRLLSLGDKAANRDLFQNIVGMQSKRAAATMPSGESNDFLHSPAADPQLRNDSSSSKLGSHYREAVPQPVHSDKPANPDRKNEKTVAESKPTVEKFGVEAVGDLTLKVSLDVPDKDFAKLVANPIFRPIHGDGSELENAGLDAKIVTNGAFRITNVAADGITLDRADNYWNKAAVNLERVRFVPHDNAEAALEAYKNGELDAVTNADFEPLALKLLTPFEDFRRTTHSALNFYEINTKKAPFNDRRVREALAISIDRERLTEGELEGSTEPALSFLPLGENKHANLSLDVEKARKLLEMAGYPRGANFPPIRLLINRNDVQQRVARSVARMWKQNLNLDTIIDVKETSELEIVRTMGDFDLIRRGIVLPTADETVSLAAIFGFAKKAAEETPKTSPVEPERVEPQATKPLPLTGKAIEKGPSDESVVMPADENMVLVPVPVGTVSEEDAIFELNAIPLYFPMSYSLVKPYVKGFETNGLDAPLLKDVSIDNGWQPNKPRGES